MSEDQPMSNPTTLCERAESGQRAQAHLMILAAGFDLKYTSPSGSRYYHLSGRRGGLLRLSDHAKEGRGADQVVSRVTLHAQCAPKNLKRHVATAIGQYMMETEIVDHGER
jgi:hypothetical protein